MTLDQVVSRLRSLGNPAALPGMARYGIATGNALGVSMPQLRSLARQIGRSHTLALELWDTGIHDARILASLVDSPQQVTIDQLELWVGDFDSWDLCDQCIMNLFARMQGADNVALAWSTRPEEFVKRAGFVIMARLASTDRSADDEAFEPFLEAIEREAVDGRNYVKKGIHWALREIGARNRHLNGRASEIATRLVSSPASAARWIGRDALRELEQRSATARFRWHD
jgi:3-methyladenine DNA glycosylase AlkD